jgi:hypothetical protein
VRLILSGACAPENIFAQSDPFALSEIEFEAEVVSAISCLFPDYMCGVFGGSFLLDGERRKADLALIHKRFTHWFVVEVELVSHSLEHHVLPQVRCFRYGDAEKPCVASLMRGFPGLDESTARRLINDVPRHVAVIANRMDPAWRSALTGLDVQLLALSVFQGPGGKRAYELEGSLAVRRESLGFGRYLPTDKSLVVPKSSGISAGPLQIEDPLGAVGLWTARDNGDSIWITKDLGDPGLPSMGYVQIVRTLDGRLCLRLC